MLFYVTFVDYIRIAVLTVVIRGVISSVTLLKYLVEVFDVLPLPGNPH